MPKTKTKRENKFSDALDSKRPANKITSHLRIRIPVITKEEEELLLQLFQESPRRVTPIFGRLNTGMTPLFKPGDFSDDDF
jgi:hypothetical protein